MNPRQRILLLILIMFSIVLSVETITIGTLYKVAISEENSRLVEIVKSQARLIEAIARFDKNYSGNYPFGPRQATISQIKDARTHYRGFGKTGEFVLSTRENDQIVFLLSHRLDEFKNLVQFHGTPSWLNLCGWHYPANLAQLSTLIIVERKYLRPMNHCQSSISALSQKLIWLKSERLFYGLP